jgi:pimeloyl-ACP methyl ester carboxylesterase
VAGIRSVAAGAGIVTGRYVPVRVGGVTYQIYSESAGSGQDVLCMHTAGADGRQFHGLMTDPRIVEHHRLVSFDLPWHGNTPPPEGAIHGSWRLNTNLYVALILGFVAAAGLEKPVALGASMSGEICLELAYRHPEAFAGIIACEACNKINHRQTVWAAHPHVNQAQFVPEWIRALSAPQALPNTWNRSRGTILFRRVGRPRTRRAHRYRQVLNTSPALGFALAIGRRTCPRRTDGCRCGGPHQSRLPRPLSRTDWCQSPLRQARRLASR